MKELSKTDYCLLIDYYGDLLNEYQKEALRMYYDCDMSYAEIAESYGISRQGARDVIARASDKISEWENKLHFVKRIGEYEKELDALIESTDGDMKEKIVVLKKKLREI